MTFERQKWLLDPWKKGGVPGPVSCFRRGFVSSGGELTLMLSALGLYEARVDGEKITENIFTPGWCDYSQRAEYNSFTLPVAPGAHVLEILLADGWYAGTISGTQWGDEAKPAMLFCRMELPGNGIVSADGCWEVSSDGPLLYSDIYMGESCDLNRKWRNWHPAGVRTVDLVVEPFSGVPVRRIREVTPVAVRGGLVDFGENLTGREKITFSAPRGTVVTIRHGEVLDENGELYTKNLRSAKATDIVIATGGSDVYEPVFTYHGFRYIEVAGVTNFEASAYVIHSVMTPHLDFKCSDELLNRLVDNIRRGWFCNALDVPTDCPQRDERVGWMGDAQVFIKAALYLCDCTCFFRRWLKDVRLAQTPEGYFTIVAPRLRRFATADAAGWADAGVICPWELYRFSGDKSFLEDNYDAVLKFVTARWRAFQQGKLPPANFGDWLNSGEETPKELLASAFLAYSSSLALKMAQILQKAGDVRRLEEIFNAEKAYFNTCFGDRLTTQTAMALALDFDLLHGERKKEVSEALDRHVREKCGIHLCTGFLGTPHLLHALSGNGFAATAWKLLEQKSCPSWLFPVLNGATTVWERWDSWTPEKGFQDPSMNSFNHYAYGAVLDWIVGVAAGISPDFDIDPHPGGSLSFMEVRYRGVFLRWEKRGNAVDYTLKVPAGIPAKFRGRALSGAEIYHFSETVG